MKDICIPIPHFEENQIAEVEVTINGKKQHFNFRVESFPWSLEKTEDGHHDALEVSEKILHLKNMIESYDKNWELIQIFTPKSEAHFIQVLFRQKTFKEAAVGV